MSKIVHVQIADTAKAIAAAVWEVCSSNDRFHKAYPHQSTFVRGKWREFIGDARKSLAAMLVPIPGKFESAYNPITGETTLVPAYAHGELMRERVFEALLIDGEHKAAPPLDLAELRKNAGFEPENYAKGHRVRLDA